MENHGNKWNEPRNKRCNIKGNHGSSWRVMDRDMEGHGESWRLMSQNMKDHVASCKFMEHGGTFGRAPQQIMEDHGSTCGGA